MKEIPLSRGKSAKVDDIDFDRLNRWKWYALKGTRTYYASKVVKENGIERRIFMHRLIMDAPEGLNVDHINGDGLDNRRANLRLCTVAQNQHNQRAIRGVSKYKGVCRLQGKWASRILVEGKRLWLGWFDTEKEAARAYDNAAKQYRGEFAFTNEMKFGGSLCGL